ncbi:MAG TPA: ABC transporter substrate-binding protein [Pseudomonas sp.]|nr:ABC transporter substrate-binding protein [Pseudomonas sp.]
MKKVFAAMSLALLAVSVGVSAKDVQEVRFGVSPDSPPFELKMADGTLGGFDIDLGNAICAKLKAECVWVENDFDGMIPALRAKKFDGVLSSMSVTEKRQKQIAFSDKLFNAPVRMVAKKGSTLLPTVESLKGKRIGVQQGTTQETYAKTYWEPQGVTVVSYQNLDLSLADLLAGRVDATLQDAVQAEIGFLKTPRGRDFAFAGPTLNDQKTLGSGTAIGLRKEDVELRQLINQALAEMHQDGTYQRLEQKYFSFSLYE